MNKIFNPTETNMRNAITTKGEFTVWDYFRHTVMFAGYMNNPHYLHTVHSYAGKRYITIKKVG